MQAFGCRCLIMLTILAIFAFTTIVQCKPPKSTSKKSPSKMSSNTLPKSPSKASTTKTSSKPSPKSPSKSHKTKQQAPSSSNKSANKQTANSVQKFPKLSEFFSKKPAFKEKTRLTQCDVTTKKEQCLFRTTPRKTHCLVFQNVIDEVTPYYRPFVGRSKLASFQRHEVKDIRINTCSKKVTMTTYPHGNFTIIPNIFEIDNVEGVISLPVPFGDFQLLAGGEWKLKGLEMKIKFSRDSTDTYSIKGYSETEFVTVSTIGEAFDIDVLPNGPISVLLKNIGLDTMGIRDCRLYGSLHPSMDIYEIAFSGEPSKEEYSGSRLRVFITNNRTSRNIAVLLELQDYSPVTLLKSLYGPSIGHATILRDRNQTIALYVSSQPTSRFSSILTAHGSGRWIHRDSKFDPGAYLLVTLPFPKRKAVDMKIKLFSDSLVFTLPESEKLYSDLALSAILPKKIMHLGVDKFAKVKDKNNQMYSKIRILRFKYFLFNDTYLAATESHISMEEELAEYMPAAKLPLPGAVSYAKITRDKHGLKDSSPNFDGNNLAGSLDDSSSSSLDSFFAHEEEKKQLNKPEAKDPLSFAESAGLL